MILFTIRQIKAKPQNLDKSSKKPQNSRQRRVVKNS